jgi:hypothetical protein
VFVLQIELHRWAFHGIDDVLEYGQKSLRNEDVPDLILVE